MTVCLTHWPVRLQSQAIVLTPHASLMLGAPYLRSGAQANACTVNAQPVHVARQVLGLARF